MKRFILPLLLIVIGGTLFYYGYSELSQPWNHPTGIPACEPVDMDSTDQLEGIMIANGCAPNSDPLTKRLLSISEAAGILFVLSGIALGIYRLVRRNHKT